MSTTNPSFDHSTTGTEVAAAFAERVRGKTFVVTGVSPNSLGSAIALALASQNPRLLILVSRTKTKLQAVTNELKSHYPTVKVELVLVDLSVLSSVREGASRIAELVSRHGGGKIDVLFNNAGINVSERKLTKEGVEMQFATNHLGPFLLTGLVVPLLGKEGARIVMTSSEGHRVSPVRFSDINQTPGAKVDAEDQPRKGLPKGILKDGGSYDPFVAYGQSKTANVLMAVGLNARLKTRGIDSFAVMPGTIMTEIVRDVEDKMMEFLKATSDWKNLDQGAATMLVAALDPKVDSANGVYLDDCQVRKPSKWAVDSAKAERLWNLSEELVGQKFKWEGGSKL